MLLILMGCQRVTAGSITASQLQNPCAQVTSPHVCMSSRFTYPWCIPTTNKTSVTDIGFSRRLGGSLERKGIFILFIVYNCFKETGRSIVQDSYTKEGFRNLCRMSIIRCLAPTKSWLCTSVCQPEVLQIWKHTQEVSG